MIALIFSVLLIGSPASAESCLGPEQKLSLVYPAAPTVKSVNTVKFSLEDKVLVADFMVKTKTLNAKPILAANEFPYQADVVEVFVSVSGAADRLPYFEFEVSPYNNTYEVQVDSLKKAFIENIKMGLESEAERTLNGWNVKMRIPLDRLGWDGDVSKVYGNAYVIQGKSPKRSFWGLTLPPQKKPSFHKPEFFKRLLNCANRP